MFYSFVFVLKELAEWNHKYEERFGHVFLICASGKSCLEVLTALKVSFFFTFGVILKHKRISVDSVFELPEVE